MSSHGADLINLMLQLATDNQTQVDSVSHPGSRSSLFGLVFTQQISW